MPGGVSRALVLEREQRAWDLSVHGHSTRTIAEELGISHVAAWKILGRVAKRKRAQFDERVATHTARQFDRLEFIVSESLRSWDASKAAKKKSRKKTLTVPVLTPQQLAAAADGKALAGPAAGSGVAREEEVKEATTSTGEAAHLQTALHAIAEENKLLGLHAPKKIDLLDKRRPLEQLSDDDLDQRIRDGIAELAGMGQTIT